TVMRLEIALRAALVLGSLHNTQTDRVDEDLVRRVLVGERLGQIDAGRARDAGRERARQRRLAANRRYVDDAAAAAALHVRDHEPAEPDGAHHLQVEVVLPGGLVDLLEA